MIPPKLKKGNRITVVSPSRSLSIVSQEVRDIAIKRLLDMDLTVGYSKNAEESDEFNSSSIKSRVEDIHEAFSDPLVGGILTTLGGFNSNQILKYLDYDLIKSHPKILCGYSDITALQNAIYAKTGLVSYYGPHFSTFGMQKGIEYTLEYFQKCLMNEDPFEIHPSKEWSDDEWYIDQENRTFFPNQGYNILNEGEAEGIIIGGNIGTLNLLQGTEFMPSLKNAILFLEDDSESLIHHFDRDLQSLIHLPDLSEVRGIVIGRFQRASEISNEMLLKTIKTKKELNSIPIICGADFGHTTPQITFPIGGKVKIEAKGSKIKIEIPEY
ncbi:LD-carboxypeptidase [Candidatus Micrarchaeota archaeon]|nr:LD-carboxypeptidase [Candidatus Micrarchaeota archaeon]